MKFRAITISLLMAGSMAILGGCAVYEGPPYHSSYYYADPVYPYPYYPYYGPYYHRHYHHHWF